VRPERFRKRPDHGRLADANLTADTHDLPLAFGGAPQSLAEAGQHAAPSRQDHGGLCGGRVLDCVSEIALLAPRIDLGTERVHRIRRSVTVAMNG
jgi:hypothetical protein